VLFRGASSSRDDSICPERDVGHTAHFCRGHCNCRIASKSQHRVDSSPGNYDFDVVAIDTIVRRKATPALMSIFSVRDGGLVVIPKLAYSPMTNLELWIRPPVQVGRTRTEYGEKQNDYRFEFRMRYHFGL
jgi:hypothetical protein